MPYNDTMNHDETIREAMDMAEAGEAKKAAQLLWPLMADATSRVEAIYPLAYCFEQADSVVTAAYLYEVLLELQPDHTEGTKHLARCEALSKARGLLEDFHDMGHRACDVCELRFRAEFGRCPYCGTHIDESVRYSEQTAKKDLPGWEDPTLVEHIQEIGLDAVEKVQGFIESEEVQQISDKIQESGQKVVSKAKEISQRQAVKDAGTKTEEKVDALVHNRTVQDAAQKIEDLSWKASEKIRGITGQSSMRETNEKARKLGRDAGVKMKDFLKREDVQDASKRVKRAGKMFSKKLRDALDPESGKNSKD